MSTRAWLTAIVIAALGLRLFFFAIDHDPYRHAGDTARQGNVARAILDGGKWGMEDVGAPVYELQSRQHRLIDPSEPEIAQSAPRYEHLVLHTQGVAIMLAGIWAITGDRDYDWLVIPQIVLLSLAALLVWWIAMQLFNRPRAALLAAGGYALCLPLAEFARYLFYDAWAVLFTLAIAALAIKSARSAQPLLSLLALGATVGIGMNFRFQLVLIVPAVALAFAVSHELPWKRALVQGLVPLALAALFVLPWTIRNAIVWDAFVPLHTGTGQVMWQGFGDRRNNPFGVTDDDQITYREVREVRPDLRYGTPAYDSYLLHRATNAIEEKPLWYAGLVGERTIRATLLSKNTNWVGAARQSSFLERRESVPMWLAKHPLDALLLAIAGLGQTMIVVAALATLLITRKQWMGAHLVLIAVIAAGILTPILLNNTWRYVAATVPFWIIMAAPGIDRAVARLAVRWR